MLRTLFLVFLKIGAFTFGGGYAMIALLENEFVEKRNWLEQKEFMDMVAIAESTPGPPISAIKWLVQPGRRWLRWAYACRPSGSFI